MLENLSRKTIGRICRIDYNSYSNEEKYFIIAKFNDYDIKNYLNLTYLVTNTFNKETAVNFFSFAAAGELNTARFNTNIDKLTKILLYKKNEDYYLVLKLTKDNKFNSIISAAFLITDRNSEYFLACFKEEFNQLGLTFVKEYSSI